MVARPVKFQVHPHFKILVLKVIKKAQGSGTLQVTIFSWRNDRNQWQCDRSIAKSSNVLILKSKLLQFGISFVIWTSMSSWKIPLFFWQCLLPILGSPINASQLLTLSAHFFVRYSRIATKKHQNRIQVSFSSCSYQTFASKTETFCHPGPALFFLAKKSHRLNQHCAGILADMFPPPKRK